MTTIRYFETEDAARQFLQSAPRYENSETVHILKGSAAHEVAVGPVHAGVIEPGHFRFQCVGEVVYNLQIFLGYQNRGVEEEICRASGNVARQIALAETCAGDTSIAAALAFSQIMEAADPALREKMTREDRQDRGILLELERLANHVGDIGAMAGDVAFLPTSSYCGRLRGEFLNMTAMICGNRFGRHAIIPGGTRVRIDKRRKERLASWLREAKRDVDNALDLMFEEPTVLERLEGTGTVSKEDAAKLGLVGVARRASDELKGDVLSRELIRRLEIDRACERIAKMLNGEDGEAPHCEETGNSANPWRVISTKTDAWRGDLEHIALVNSDNAIAGYRIVDPSVYNWQGLALAMRGTPIADFPICNKSFNLSYCGVDR